MLPTLPAAFKAARSMAMASFKVSLPTACIPLCTRQLYGFAPYGNVY